jgi:hypothetical protein
MGFDDQDKIFLAQETVVTNSEATDNTAISSLLRRISDMPDMIRMYTFQ